MAAFSVGDTVQITGSVMTGNVGTVVHVVEAENKYLVRIDAATQNWFAAEDLQLFQPH